MKTRLRAAAFSGVCAIAAVLLSCVGQPPSPPPDPRVVEAVSGGIVPRVGPVLVAFNEGPASAGAVPAAAFRLDPPVDAELSWADGRTLRLTPRVPLEGGKRYRAFVRPSLVPGLDPAAGDFSFEFVADIPRLDVSFAVLRADDGNTASIRGKVLTDGLAEPAAVERALRAAGLPAPAWKHGDGEHSFAIEGLPRGAVPRAVTVAWDGSPIGSKVRGSREFRLPAAGSFELVGAERTEDGGIELAFSSPLKKDQDLRGYVSVGGSGDLRWSIDGSVARIYGRDGIAGGAEVAVRDLKAADGASLAVPVSLAVGARWELPEVRFPGKGVVLPSSQGTTMALETRNVAGVIVQAFAVRGDNMVQFLQVNDLAGSRELVRVGEPVWTKEIDFDWKASDKDRWVRRGLDLSALAAAHPGGLFQIRVAFAKRHVRYECPAGHPDFSGRPFPDPAFDGAAPPQDDEESSYWDYYEENWERRQERYQYRRDPCHPAYYARVGDHDVAVKRNVLASDLGLAAKATPEGDWLAFATDLRTAKAAGGTRVRLLNYQGRELAAAAAGADGIAQLSSREAPSFMLAEGPQGRAYLKLDEGAALSTGHFDLSGDKPVRGVKGFIYGERGVWRPGDPIYLTFLLLDTRKDLPADHPVLFELEDPRGRIASKATFTSSVDGFYPIRTGTSPDAPTGDWTARVRVGASVFSKPLKIETVMPNRLKMTLDTGGGAYLASEPTTYALFAAWLHGAPAPGLSADVSAVFADSGPAFPDRKGYVFSDPTRTVPPERRTLFEGVLGSDSRATFSVALSPGASVPGKLKALFTTRVFEPTGVFSSEQVAFDYHPYGRYVGMKLPKGDAARGMLLTDTDQAVDILVLDRDGQPVRGDVDLECSVHKLRWRWWWEKGGDEAAEYASALSSVPVARAQVRASKGNATWKFQVKYPDWGRYLVSVRDPQGGHAAASIVYMDWPGWAGAARADGDGGASAMLGLNVKEASYAPGRVAAVDFPSNERASAYVVVEKGGRVVRRERIACRKESTRYEFPVTADMAPNVYVHVTLLQEHLQTANDLPVRLYGIAPVVVDDPATKLQPVVEAAEAWAPLKDASFSVREASGRPMTYTVAVVDEGLLGLTRYAAPDPRAAFYRKEASFLRGWDMYSQVMGAYAGKLETLLAIGGGDDGFGKGERKAERFKPVVRFFGPYRLAAGETRTETFRLPQYVGALRVMVVAGRDGAYGTAERSVPVKGDLMALATLPRVLSPGDEIAVPVTVFSYAPSGRKVTVRCEVSGAASFGGSASAGSSASHVLEFAGVGEAVAEFRAKASGVPGVARFSIVATAEGAEPARHDVELDVRSTALPVSEATSRVVAPGDVWIQTFGLPGAEGSNAAALELSRLPPLGLESRLAYLLAYPHGCIEQTTSAAFPQLYLDKVMELDAASAAKARANAAAAVERLAAFQTADGGFAYWPGEPRAHEWGSSYGGHFLAEARRRGFAVPDGVMDKWAVFQRSKAAAWSRTDDQGCLQQAYRLYVLALAGKADLGSMNRLREGSALPPQAAWRLAAAYWHAGARDAAASMVRGLVPGAAPYRELDGTFGSDFRDKAMILETLSLVGDSSRAGALLAEVSARLASDAWLSTQETAYALIAVLPYAAPAAAGTPLDAAASFAGKTLSTVSGAAIASLDFGPVPGTSGELQVKNRTRFPLHARFVRRGVPAEGSERERSDGLSLTIAYRDLAGAAVEPEAVAQGSDVEVRARVVNTGFGDLKNVALVQALPASWEIMNYRLAKVVEPGADEKAPAWTYQDVRDDRVMTYFDLPARGEKEIVFRANRSYAGTFYLPAAHAYAMYDESIRAVVPGRVLKPGPSRPPTFIRERYLQPNRGGAGTR